MSIQKDKADFKRSGFDRRSVRDRRIAYSLNYFEKGGLNRRQDERRLSRETRIGWIRIARWSSVYAGDYIFSSKPV